MSAQATPLKERLRADLTAAIKSRDKVRSGTIRMVLSAISEAEVAGASAIELSEQQALDVVIREAKKRREAEEAFAAAGRAELAAKERGEAAVLVDYLPRQLSAQQVSAIVAEAIAETTASTGAPERGLKAMGQVMGLVTPRTKGRADGAAVAAEVRRQLA